MKGGLRQASLSSVKLTFTRQQSLAQQTLRSLQRQTFMEVLVVGDQNVFDVVGMI
jgi:hypothetical protein